MAEVTKVGTTETQARAPEARTAEARPIERARPTNQLARGGWERHNPFAMMRQMFDQMDRLLGFGRSPFEELDVWRDLPQGLWSPQIDVHVKDGKLLVHADLPGLEPKDVEVRVENDVLTIKGERRNEYENEEGGNYRAERSYGKFERRIALPPGLDPEGIEARFDNGVLEIAAMLPKEQAGRKIDVKTGPATPQPKGPTH